MSGRVRTSTILQMEAAECGAVCLSILLAHYGRHVPLEELRAETGVSRDGSSAFGIIDAARRYGLDADGYRVEVEDLQEVRLPAIMHWQLNHFVVLEGFGRRTVYLNDPATGPRRVGPEALDEGFSGVVIELEPRPDFVRGGSRPGVFSLAGHWLAGARHALLFFLLTGLLLAVPRLVIPAFGQIMVDQVLVRGIDDWLLPLALGMALTSLLLGALTWLERYHLLRFEQRLAIGASARLFHHILRLPLNFFTQRFSGDIAARLSVSDEISSFLARDLSAILLSLLMLVLFALAMGLYNPSMMLAVVLFGLLDIWVLLRVSAHIRSSKLRYLQGLGLLVGRTADALHTIESIKASGAEADALTAYTARHATVINEDQQLTATTTLLLVVPDMLHGCCYAMVLLLGGLEVMEGQMTLGMLVAFQGLASSFLAPVAGLVRLGSRIQEMNAGAQRIDDIVAQPPDARHPAGRIDDGQPWRLAGSLELRNVTFGYARRGTPAIESLSLELQPGRSAALVGASGSGKSTVARLAAGLYSPWEGEIRIGDRPLAEIPAILLGGSVALVDQEISLFADTVQNNLTLWDGSVSAQTLEAACQAACIHRAILERPGGLDHRLTEGGSNFSGGERQRLEIARALAADPALLILDEATSALDPATEQQVLENMQARGITLLVVAHRISTFRDCDEIIVLERGRVVGRGRHSDLYARCEPYRRLVEEG